MIGLKGLLEQETDFGAGYSQPFITPMWMSDFSVSVYGLMRCVKPGLTGTNDTKLAEFFDWHAQSIVGRTGTSGETEYLYRDVGQYQISMAPVNFPDFATGAGPFYAHWGEVWARTNLYQSMGGPKEIGDGSLRGDNGIIPNSYFANAIPALAYAVRWGVPGAREGWQVFIPPLSYCTDNAAMIAMAGHHLLLGGIHAPLDITPVPRQA